MDRKQFAFGKTNFTLLTISMAVIIIGFILMTGSGTTETTFNADIFSARRVKVAPLVCLAGFVGMIVAIMYKPCTCSKKETKE